MSRLPRTSVSRGSSRDSSRDPAGARFHFFGGKGGVGKTTLAAAFAVHASASRPTLILSTDPAHSLGDALETRLTANVKRVGRTGKLFACELDAPKALERWLDPKRETLRAIAERGTYLDREDIERFLHLSFPGVDELIALLEIVRLAQERDYETVVVDTAPTGHTLRLLAMPQTLRAMARVFNGMQEKHRVMAETIRGRYAEDATDALISQIESEGRALQEILSDEHRTHFHWVLLPEALSVAETRDGLRALREQRVPVSELVVNRVTPKPPGRCALCDGRRVEERNALASLLDERFADETPAVRFIPAQEQEPRGAAALKRIARPLLAPDRGRALLRKAAARKTAAPRPQSSRFPLEVRRETRLLFFGGKGGVGKTTCAAATALTVAREEPTRRVLLLSTDPARRMGDALQHPLDDRDLGLPGAPTNFRVRELNADRAFERERERYRTSVDELFDRLRGNSNFDAAYDRAVVRDLIDLAPPGLDELFALFAVVDTLFPTQTRKRAPERPFDLVVVDTAPTGHALRLLDIPDVALEWTHALMEVLLKYRAVGGVGSLAEDLLALARQLKQLRALLSDRERSRFVVVTRPERLPRVESERLIRALDERHIARGQLLFNAMTPPGCARCQRIARRERLETQALLRAARLRGQKGAAIFAPALPRPPRGLGELQDFAMRWTSE